MSRFTLLGAALIILTACSAGVPASPTIAPTPPDLTQPTPADTEPAMSLTPEPLPPSGDVPAELFRAMAEDAAAVAGVPVGELVVDRAEAVVWSDGSLGCPARGELYTQALVEGYWVVLRAAGQEFDFRASQAGEVKLCPPGQGRPPIEP